VGCGDGALVEELRLLGYELSRGIDPMRVLEEGSSRDSFVERKTLDQVEGVWDLVMFHHSFEHLADPGAALALVADLLATGGVCLLRLPIVPCYAWEHYGANWVQLDAPRHLFIHSRRSIEKLSAAAGLEIASCWRDSEAFQFWGSERYAAGLTLKGETGGPPVTRSALREYARAADGLNRAGQGDQAAFVLRRA
jgi:SAM-dependent methyltransferase